MTAAERTKWSRRRAAAISFLANISLDGSHTNSSFNLFTKKDSVVPDSSGDCKVDLTDESDLQISNEVTLKGFKSLQENEKFPDSIQTITVFEKSATYYAVGAKATDPNKNSSVVTPFRERTNTTGSDYCNNYRKKLLQQASLNDEKSHHFSSSESIGSVIGRGKAAGAMLETVGLKEVRFLKPKQFRSHRLKDERLILATGNKIPLAIFSHFPYDRNYKICSENFGSTEEIELWKCNESIKHFSINPYKFWFSPSVWSFTSCNKTVRGRI